MVFRLLYHLIRTHHTAHVTLAGYGCRLPYSVTAYYTRTSTRLLTQQVHASFHRLFFFSFTTLLYTVLVGDKSDGNSHAADSCSLIKYTVLRDPLHVSLQGSERRLIYWSNECRKILKPWELLRRMQLQDGEAFYTSLLQQNLHVMWHITCSGRFQ